MKRGIKTKEEANHYYDIVNRKVDQYISEWNVRPSKLLKYMSSKGRLESFLKGAGLDDVEGIETIVQDVLDDRAAMESDKVMTFESFSTGQGEPVEGHERAAAEHCRTSLGHVSKLDGFDRIFEVEDMGEARKVCVMSQGDLEELKGIMIESATAHLLVEEVDVHSIDMGLESGKKVRTRITIPIGQIADKDKLASVIASLTKGDKLISVATDYINDYPVTKAGMKFEHRGRVDIDGTEYEVWESKRV